MICHIKIGIRVLYQTNFIIKNNMITPEELKEYEDQMQECIDNSFTEVAHSTADDILCELLVDLGYTRLVELYNDVDKWYA